MYLALASLKKRGRVGIPSLREIEQEIEMLYGPQISQKTISRVLRRLEEKGLTLENRGQTGSSPSSSGSR